jgi:hypothetical protein
MKAKTILAGALLTIDYDHADEETPSHEQLVVRGSRLPELNGRKIE